MKQTVSVGNKQIGEGAPTFIMAEAGLNHNGQLKLAKELIQKAVEVHADAIKFQSYITEKFVNLSSPAFKLFKKYELSFQEFQELSDIAKELGIIFLSTPLDIESADFLEKLGVQAFKVASCDLTNLPFLEYLSKKGKPIILSTGMATLEEVAEAVDVIDTDGNQNLVLLHCVSSYPASLKDVNLRAMLTLNKRFKVPVGFSDHTSSLLTPIVAVSMGASLIEKHFTLDKTLPGPDHCCSFDIKEFSEMVNSIRLVEEMLGSSLKKPAKAEISIRDSSRRSITANVNIPKGTKISKNMITFKAPGNGIPPKNLMSVIGRHAKADISPDEVIKWEKIR